MQCSSPFLILEPWWHFIADLNSQDSHELFCHQKYIDHPVIFLENNFSCGNGNSRDSGDCNYLTIFLFSASFIFFLNVHVERVSNKIAQETGIMRQEYWEFKY